MGAEGQVADVQAAIDAAKRVWEDEKQQLTKARDEAAQREQVYIEIHIVLVHAYILLSGCC